jgi:hypothetical protein
MIICSYISAAYDYTEEALGPGNPSLSCVCKTDWNPVREDCKSLETWLE